MQIDPLLDGVADPKALRLLAASRIWSQGGHAAVSGMIDRASLDALKAEAERARPMGQRTCLSVSHGTENRGGSPARALRSSPCGEAHRALYASPYVAKSISELCGVAVASSGVGTYHFYEHEGDFFGLHRDFVGCDIAMITCLSQRVTDQPMGGLLVYPNLFRQRLSEVRAEARTKSLTIPLLPGESTILLGGQLPHEVTRIAAGQDRVVAVNCYRLRET
jgi:hypothetical protein